MRIISWNVNGINSCVGKGLINFMQSDQAQVFCFQEVKASPEKIPQELKELSDFKGYYEFGEKKGYSGVSIYTKIEPLSVIQGLGSEEIDREGRVLTLEFKDFFLLNVYFPHSSRDLKRLDFKLNFNNKLLEFCEGLRKTKPIVIASDFNVAHKEIDLTNPKSNAKNAGFTIEERNWFDKLITSGYVDTFREFSQEPGNYTWWSYMRNARERNIGWRIDYFVVHKEFMSKVIKSEILNKVLGSDHCPIALDINTNS